MSLMGYAGLITTEGQWSKHQREQQTFPVVTDTSEVKFSKSGPIVPHIRLM